MSAEYDLKRYRAEANRLRGEISKASSTVAAKHKKAADARTSASKSKNASTVKSKLSEGERASKDAIDAEKKRGDLEKKLAETEVKVTKAQEKAEKEREVSQKRMISDIQRRADLASSQFEPLDRPVSPIPDRSAGRSEAASDIFLSHASEDKAELARPLREALEQRGVSVWFDEIQIKVGQSIRQEIERGIATCRFGVVVVSPHFFAKQWTNAELDALFNRKMDSGQNMVLPVWHRVSKDEVMQHSPLLSGILALNSAVMTVDEMADALTEAVRDI